MLLCGTLLRRLSTQININNYLNVGIISYDTVTLKSSLLFAALLEAMPLEATSLKNVPLFYVVPIYYVLLLWICFNLHLYNFKIN